MVMPTDGWDTIYGNYVAPAVAENGGGPWHIINENDENKALCGRELRSDRRYMDLHVAFVECCSCQKVGKAIYQKEDPDEGNTEL